MDFDDFDVDGLALDPLDTSEPSSSSSSVSGSQLDADDLFGEDDIEAGVVKISPLELAAKVSQLGVYTWGGEQKRSWRAPDVSEPQHQRALIGLKLEKLACGADHTLAVTSQGEVYAFGSNSYGECGGWDINGRVYHARVVDGFPKGTHIVDVSGGGHFSAALDREGHVYTWGRGHVGQLGRGSNFGSRKPQRVLGALDGCRVVKISCGYSHMGALTEEGDLYMWGWGTHGRLGLGHDSSVNLPTRVGGCLATIAVSTFACGGGHTVCASADRVYAWGWNAYSQLGHQPGRYLRANQAPRQVNVPTSDVITQVACGHHHSIAMTDRGLVYIWGSNLDGQIGHVDSGFSWNFRTAHIPVLAFKGAVDIAAGGYHSVALQADGTVNVWGRNTHKQVGVDGRNRRTVFNSDLPGKHVSAGAYFTAVMTQFPDAPKPRCDMRANMSDLWSRLHDDDVPEDFTDTLIFGKSGEPVRAHKIILACTCNFFREKLFPNLPPLGDPIEHVFEADSTVEVTDDEDVSSDEALEENPECEMGEDEEGADPEPFCWNSIQDPEKPKDPSDIEVHVAMPSSKKGKSRKAKEKERSATGASSATRPSRATPTVSADDVTRRVVELRLDQVPREVLLVLVRFLYTQQFECPPAALDDVLLFAAEHGPKQFALAAADAYDVRAYSEIKQDGKLKLPELPSPMRSTTNLQEEAAETAAPEGEASNTTGAEGESSSYTTDAGDSKPADKAEDSAGDGTRTADASGSSGADQAAVRNAVDTIRIQALSSLASAAAATVAAGRTQDTSRHATDPEDHTAHGIDLSDALIPELADVAFEVDGEIILASRAILRVRCPKLRAMFDSGMREADAKVIRVAHHSAEVFRLMIEWLYHDHAMKIRPDIAPHLLICANECGLFELGLRCETIISRYLDDANVTSLLILADEHQAPFLRAECIFYLTRSYDDIGVARLREELTPELFAELNEKAGRQTEEAPPGCIIL